MANPAAKTVPPPRPKPRARPSKRRIIFITGTDTGVGKTVITSLLLAHLRGNGVHALAIKPFCSGSRADALILQSLQSSELEIDQVNPWFFPRPLAPLMAGRKSCPPLRTVVRHIRAISTLCDTLLIEGAGGLLVPLGECYTVADLISELGCEVFVVTANRLGCINHTLLTVDALRTRHVASVNVVLSTPPKTDPSARTNHEAILRFLGRVRIRAIPFLSGDLNRPETLERHAGRLKELLAELLE